MNHLTHEEANVLPAAAVMELCNDEQQQQQQQRNEQQYREREKNGDVSVAARNVPQDLEHFYYQQQHYLLLPLPQQEVIHHVQPHPQDLSLPHQPSTSLTT